MTPSIPRVDVVQNAYVVPDVAKAAEQFHALYGIGPFLFGPGLEIAMASRGRGDYWISFVDARPALGHMVEIYPDHPGLRALYERIRQSAANWDGQDLLIPL